MVCGSFLATVMKTILLKGNADDYANSSFKFPELPREIEEWMKSKIEFR